MRYTIDLAQAGARLPHKLAQGLLARDLAGWLRVEFVGTAARTGLLDALRGPSTELELRDRLDVANAGLLRSFLELGFALGELARDGDQWKLRGARSRAVSDPAVDGLRGFVEELAGYDTDVYRALVGRLRGEPPGDYLPEWGEVVARGSRLVEPVLAALVHDVVGRLSPRTVLDVGCGTGVYLRHLAGASPSLAGVGIDIQAGVVDLARNNLSAWGIAGRFRIEFADASNLPPDLTGPWDLILLFQNIYYWPIAARPELLTHLREAAPKGAVVVATVVAGTENPAAAHFDVVLQSTLGSYPLPTPEELRDALTGAGFRSIEERRLLIGQPLRAFIAS